MKVTVLDDYQHAIAPTEAIARLRQKADVQIFTEKLAHEDELVDKLKNEARVI